MPINNKKHLESKIIDRLFLECEKYDKDVDLNPTRDELSHEQLTYEATPFLFIEDFLRHFNPKPWHTVYDLGSGFGRVVIYGAMHSPAFFKGIELIPKRVEYAELIRKKLDINNAMFFSGNVLNFKLDDGDIFFLFNPFSFETLSQVGEKLREISQKKQIKIATWGGPSNEYFSNRSWLFKVEDSRPIVPKLNYFLSK